MDGQMGESLAMEVLKTARILSYGFMTNGLYIDREDLVAEAACVAVKAYQKYNASQSKFLTYASIRMRGSMISMVRNLHHTSKRKVKKTSVLLSTIGHDQFISDPSNNPTQSIEREDELEAISNYTSSARWKILVELYAAGKTQRQLAKEMHLCQDTISRWSLAALREVRREITETDIATRDNTNEV